MKRLIALAIPMIAAGAQAQSPAQNYLADMTCAAMAQTEAIDPSPTLTAHSDGVAKATELAGMTRKRAIASGQSASKTVEQVNADIAALSQAEVQTLDSLPEPAKTNEHTRIGRSLIQCALSAAHRDISTNQTQ